MRTFFPILLGISLAVLFANVGLAGAVTAVAVASTVAILTRRRSTGDRASAAD